MGDATRLGGVVQRGVLATPVLSTPMLKALVTALMLVASSSPAHAQFSLKDLAKQALKARAAAPAEEIQSPAPPSLWSPPVDRTEKQRLNGNYKRTIIQGVALGALLAGGAAALFGADKETIAWAAVGGGAAGGVIAKNYADKFETMSKSKKRTDDQIAALEANNVALGQSLDAVDKNIAYINSEIAVLRRQLRRGAVQQVQLDQFREDALQDLKDSQAALDRADVTYAEAQSTLESIKTSSSPNVQAAKPRAEIVVASLGLTKKRADSMRRDLSATIHGLG